MGISMWILKLINFNPVETSPSRTLRETQHVKLTLLVAHFENFGELSFSLKVTMKISDI